MGWRKCLLEAMNTKYDQLDERNDTDTQANVSTKIFIYRENVKQAKQSASETSRARKARRQGKIHTGGQADR